MTSPVYTSFGRLATGDRFRLREPKRGPLLVKVDATGFRPVREPTGNVNLWAGGHVAKCYQETRVYPVRD